MSMLSKTIHLIVAFLFVYFAAVQYNDRDGILWMFIYLAIAAMPILKVLKFKHKHLNYFLIGFLPMLVFLKFNYLTDWLDAGRPSFIDYEPTSIEVIEGIREFLGLVLCLFVSIIYAFIKNETSNKEK